MIVGAYGQDWVTGVLAEHLSADAVTLQGNCGRTFVATDEGTFPVLCGELIEIGTEDGPIVGRCGLQVHNNGYACPGHQEMIEAWRSDPDLWHDEDF